MEQFDLSKYDYELPKDRIAQFPLGDRAKSKLLVADVNNRTIKHHRFYELPDLIQSNSHLFINTTKVIPARLNLIKNTGGRAELLLLEPLYPSQEYETAMNSPSPVRWKCIVGGHRIKASNILLNQNTNIQEVKHFQAEIINIKNKEAIAELYWEPSDIPFAKMIYLLGNTPLPPYINREAIGIDKNSYQTVFAKYDGSVAAPTAGLHFTQDVLSKIKSKGINISEIILHVGAGTFLPIENDDVSSHIMHSELFTVTFTTIFELLESIKLEKNIIATGTTTLRTLESLYWLRVKISKGYKLSDDIFIYQNEPHLLLRQTDVIDAFDSLNLLLEAMQKNDLHKITGRTQIFILPNYEFKIVKSLITNFHVPKSTLILLISAFLGDDFWKQVYADALVNGYRFLSYGDVNYYTR